MSATFHQYVQTQVESLIKTQILLLKHFLGCLAGCNRLVRCLALPGISGCRTRYPYSLLMSFCVLLDNSSRLPEGLPHVHRGKAMSFRDKPHGLPFTMVM